MNHRQLAWLRAASIADHVSCSNPEHTVFLTLTHKEFSMAALALGLLEMQSPWHGRRCEDLRQKMAAVIAEQGLSCQDEDA